MTDCCKNGREPSGSIKCGEFLKDTRKCLLASQEGMWFKQLGYLVIWLDDQPASQ